MRKRISLFLCMMLVISLFCIPTFAGTGNIPIVPIFIVDKDTTPELVRDAQAAYPNASYAVAVDVTADTLALLGSDIMYYCPVGATATIDMATWKGVTGKTSNIVAFGPGLKEEDLPILKGQGMTTMFVSSVRRGAHTIDGVEVLPLNTSTLGSEMELNGALASGNATAMITILNEYCQNPMRAWCTSEYIIGAVPLKDVNSVSIMRQLVTVRSDVQAVPMSTFMAAVASGDRYVLSTTFNNTDNYWVETRDLLLWLTKDSTSTDYTISMYYNFNTKNTDAVKEKDAIQAVLTSLNFEGTIKEFYVRPDTSLQDAVKAVEKAEAELNEANYNNAVLYVSALEAGTDKTELLGRLAVLKDRLYGPAEFGPNSSADMTVAKEALETALRRRTRPQYNKALDEINRLKDCTWKTEALRKLRQLDSYLEADEKLQAILDGKSIPTASTLRTAEDYVEETYGTEYYSTLYDKLNLIKKFKDLYDDYEEIKDISKKDWEDDDYDDLKDIYDDLKDMEDCELNDYIKGQVKKLLESMQDQLDIQDDDIKEYKDDEQKAVDALKKAESTPTESNRDKAADLIDDLKKSSNKSSFEKRLDIVDDAIGYLDELEKLAKKYDVQALKALKSKIDDIKTDVTKKYVVKEYNKVADAYNLIADIEGESSLDKDDVDDYKKKINKLDKSVRDLVLGYLEGDKGVAKQEVLNYPAEYFPFTLEWDEWSKLQKSQSPWASKCTAIARDGAEPHWSDLPANHWAYNAATTCARQGFLQGTSYTTFSPKSQLTLADTCVALDRVLLGKAKYSDIQQTRTLIENRLTDKTHWAYYNVASVLSRMDATALGYIGSPVYSRQLTREEVALLVYEMLGHKVTLTGQSRQFVDSGKIKYTTAVDFCVRTGILRGDNNNRINPQGVITRAELCSILVRVNTIAQ